MASQACFFVLAEGNKTHNGFSNILRKVKTLVKLYVSVDHAFSSIYIHWFIYFAIRGKCFWFISAGIFGPNLLRFFSGASPGIRQTMLSLIHANKWNARQWRILNKKQQQQNQTTFVVFCVQTLIWMNKMTIKLCANNQFKIDIAPNVTAFLYAFPIYTFSALTNCLNLANVLGKTKQ